MYSSPPSPIGGGVRAGPKDWFGLHGCQTRHTSLSFLQQARSWLDAHPKEIIVVWSSRHGDTRLTGADQARRTHGEHSTHFISIQPHKNNSGGARRPFPPCDYNPCYECTFACMTHYKN